VSKSTGLEAGATAQGPDSTLSGAVGGRALRVGDDVDTDQIIAARHLVTTDPEELGAHLLEATYAGLAQRAREGDVIVAGENFGCGSSREHAPLAILGAGIRCVIARSFARIFFRNAINVGLLPLEAPDAAEAIADGSPLQVDRTTGAIVDLATGRRYHAAPLPEFVQGIVDAGGLVAWVRREHFADADGVCAQGAGGAA